LIYRNETQHAAGKPPAAYFHFRCLERNNPMPERLLVDHRARNDASRAIALIETHIAVCEERGRQEDAFQARTEDFLKRLQAAFETATSGMHSQIETLGDRLRRELQKHQEDDARTLREIDGARASVLVDMAAKISAATRPIYNRFWTLAVSLIGALFLLSGFLAAKLLGWL
jgi:hypothetical protein